MPDMPLTVREMTPDDLSAVRAIGRHALPTPLNWLMMATAAKTGLVAVEGDSVIGAMTLRHTDIAGRRWGIFDWGVVEPKRQGQGIGRRLGEQALLWFEARGCQELITTDIDGYNSPSWRAAYAQGLRYWPASEQLRALGWQWPRLMVAIPHIGVSTFILHAPLDGAERSDDPATRSGVGAWGAALLWAVVLLLIGQVRNIMWTSTDPADLLAPLAPGAIALSASGMALYFGARTLGHWLAARAEGVPLAFRFWESGTSMALLLGATFGTYLPAYTGSFYARDPHYDYMRDRAPFGKIMLVGILGSMALLVASQLVLHAGPASLASVARIGRGVGTLFAITDVLSFFPPLDAMPAGRLWHWNRKLWLLMVVAYGAILIALPRLGH